MNNIKNEKMSETKIKILEISLDLFSKQGFKGTSIRQIANAVGIKGASIYNHFGGKEEILQAIFSIYRPRSFRENLINNTYLEQIKENPDNFITVFDNEIINGYKTNEHWSKLYKLIIMEMFQNETVGTIMKKNILQDAKNAFKHFFDELKKCKLIKNIDTLFLANEFLNILISSNIEILLIHNDDNFDYYIDLLRKRIEFFWKNIKS
ncbi:TetR/AcrR family transcriptional regulator [Tepidibacter hydrothermalis]|uniref:TetR/AcrR family transcriptional regulator n=1 Tax=Tepidibacter hydrothermalis TaxID=3036126 RepID=A0ABY8EG68_9FIRM|nr:TetR/AcrR family transcriptional regulator [Tepidibacter hydrothermalis]WFD11948.1 TetR/AcrR family transcriptional regulator [Tepidibacter hydrothermalis]